MGDIFDGISLEELAGGETVVDPKASGMSQEGDTQNAKNAEEAPATSAKEETSTEVDDPDAIDITELANQGSVANEEEEDDSKTSSQTPTDNKGKQSPSSQKSDATTSLASALADVGVFSSLSEEEVGEIKSAEDLVNAVRKQTEENRYADLTEDQKNYLEALSEGIPEKQFHDHATATAQYRAISDDQIIGNGDLTKELIRRSLIIKGIDNATATEMAQLQSSKADGGAKAILAKQTLVQYEENILKGKIDEKRSSRLEAIEAEKEGLLNLKAKIQQADEILPGIKVNTQTKNKIFDAMTNGVKEDENGQQLNELMVKYQEDPDFRYKLHAMYQVTKGLTDFTKFKNTAKSNAIDELEQKLKSGSSTRTGASQNEAMDGRSARDIAASLPSSFGRK